MTIAVVSCLQKLIYFLFKTLMLFIK